MYILFCNSGDLFYLVVTMLLYLPPIGGYYLMNIAKLGLFYLTNVILILVFNWVYLFVVVSRWHFWGFGICKVANVLHNYAMVAGILGIE